LLGIVFVGGALVRHFMNIRFTFERWLPALLTSAIVPLGAVVFIVARPQPAPATAAPANVGDHVSFTSVQLVISERCVPCHSVTPTDKSLPAPPPGIRFDTPDEIKTFSSRIKARAVTQRTMPLANKTGMTDDERDLLARWFLQGAKVD
jgi:uncharacterized membrane protein